MSREWRSSIETRRREKNQFFRENPRSPVPVSDRDDFDGLSYFSVDSVFRFELPLCEHVDKHRLTIETTTGGTQEYLRWGVFEFSVSGESISLQAYKSDSSKERFWVPFRDETNTEETYGAGRYLDLSLEEHSLGDERWLVDFNEAYNPFCAYSEAYECPLIPVENWLSVRIEAGVKDYDA